MSTTLVSRAINLPLMWTLHDECVKIGVKYGFGVKAKLGSQTGTFSSIDCSGQVRWLLHRTSEGKFLIPDGSWNQRDWCQKQGFPEVEYESMATPKPGRLFIAFITSYVNGAGKVGHVWLLAERNDKMVTLESYGGKGVGSLPWSNATRRTQVHKCFEIPATMGDNGGQALPSTPSIAIPEYSGPGFETVVNNTGKSIGASLIFNGELYVPARSLLNEIGQDIVKSGDRRDRTSQPRFYIEVGKKESS